MTKNFEKQNYGIYGITNTVTGKMYIGQTVTSFEERWYEHRKNLKNGNHKNLHLRNSAAKYGHKTFRIDALEVGPPGLTREERVAWCNKREEYWIGDSYLSSDYYNQQSGGANAIPGPETRKRQSEAKIGDKNPKYWQGKSRRLETNQKISDALKGRRLGPESRQKQIESMKASDYCLNRPKKPCQFCGRLFSVNGHGRHERACKHKEQ